jgi:hypothetical protein
VPRRAGTQDAKVVEQTSETVSVMCYGPNGALMDTYYALLLGS